MRFQPAAVRLNTAPDVVATIPTVASTTPSSLRRPSATCSSIRQSSSGNAGVAPDTVRPAPRHQRLFGWVPTYFRSDRQLLLVDHAVAGGHHFRIEGHLDRHAGKRLRHEREHVWIVVAQVVAPQERVVDASAVEAWDVAFEIAEIAAEQVDLVLVLATVLPCQQAAGRNSDGVEAERIGSDRSEQLVVE